MASLQDTRRDDVKEQEDQPRQHALGISPAQVAGSALAAVSAAVSASWLGVTGTLIGAALASVVGTVGSAMYTYSLRQGGTVVRRSSGLPSLPRPVREDGTPATLTDLTGDQEVPEPPPAVAGRGGWRALPWGRIAIGAAAVLVVALGTLTLVEGLAGKPVSSIATGSDTGGTTLGRVVVDSGSGEQVEVDPVIPTPTPDTPNLPGPTEEPSETPTEEPTEIPTEVPTEEPSEEPTDPAPVDPTVPSSEASSPPSPRA